MENSSTRDTITIEWDSASGNSACGPVEYIVTVVNLMDGNVHEVEESQTTITFDDLINDIMYEISVAAINRAGRGPSSPPISVTGNARGT